MNIGEQMPEPDRDPHEAVLQDIKAAERQNGFKRQRDKLKAEHLAKEAELMARIGKMEAELQEYATLYALSEHNLKMALANLNLHRARQNGHHH